MSGNSLPPVTGAYTGTGSLVTVTVGYRPRRVELINAGDPCVAIHNDSMPDGSAYLDDGTPAFVTSAAVTLTSDGFTVGTNAALNTAGETVYWSVFGS